MKLYQHKPSLNSKQQNELYDKYILTGDEDYKTKIAISYVKVISAIVNSMNFDLDKEDVISEMVMIVYNAIDNYDKSKASIFTFLYRIVYCKTIDKLRKSNTVKKYKVDFDLDELLKTEDVLSLANTHEYSISKDYNRVTDGQGELIHRDNSRFIQKALKKLTKRERDLIVMRHINNESITYCLKNLHVSRKVYNDIETSGLNKMRRNKVIQEIKKVNYE